MIADIYKAGVRAAELERFDDRVEFRYLHGYDGDPVASTLPLSTEPTTAPARQLPAFFAGLLPEGRRLDALRRVLKVSADDELAQMLAVGGDTIGDVQIVAHGKGGGHPTPMVDEQPWEEIDLQEMFEESVGGAPETRFDRVAIPGVQPKMSGKASREMISFPKRSSQRSGSSGFVIIKLDPSAYPDITAIEAAMLDAAHRSGRYRVPYHQLITDRSDRRALVVDRFDRVRHNGTVKPLPVEDGCQVLGRYPADKYDIDTIDVINGLADRCASPPTAKLELLQRFLLSYLACDGDMHARNLAIYRDEGGLWRPTPVYDVVSTCPYGDMTHAAPFAGNTTLREIGRRRFLEAAALLGLPDRAVESMLDRTVQPLIEAILEAFSQPPFTRFPQMPKTIRIVKKRARLLSE